MRYTLKRRDRRLAVGEDACYGESTRTTDRDPVGGMTRFTTPPRSAAAIHRQVAAIAKEQGWIDYQLKRDRKGEIRVSQAGSG